MSEMAKGTEERSERRPWVEPVDFQLFMASPDASHVGCHGDAALSSRTNISRTFELVLPVPASGLADQVEVLIDYAGQPDTPRACRMSSVDTLPSTGSLSRSTRSSI